MSHWYSAPDSDDSRMHPLTIIDVSISVIDKSSVTNESQPNAFTKVSK